MKLQDGQTILFTGDSITDCGRGRPVGLRAGLGNGYVALVDSLLASAHPDQRVRVLNTGISGNTVVDLDARWQTDVLDLDPDWLAVMIGINDVWRRFDNHLDPDQVTIDRYERVYRELLKQTRPRLQGLVLMTPYYIEANTTDPLRTEMDAYGRVVNALAGEFDAVFVDTQAAFDAYLRHRPTQELCGDRVHPNQTGHMILARAFLHAMDYDWNHTGRHP